MKERIVFKTESSIKGRKEIAKINEYVNNFNFDCAFERKVEKVPENWEELKELCEDLESKDVFITSAGDCIEYHGLQFWVSGTVCHETEKFYSIKSDRTPQQMWQIIKNLIGE